MLFIIGNGGLGNEILSYCEDAGYSIWGLVDTEKGSNGKYPVILESELPNGAILVCGLGDIRLRKKVIERLENKYEFASLAFGKASTHSTYGKGLITAPTSIITARSVVGNYCLVGVHACIAHDCRVGNNCVLSPAAQMNGNVTLGNNVFLGTGAIVIPKVSICDDVIVGAGTVVTKDITESGTYVGVPARKVK